ncbi:Uncharacterised protein [Bordetella pertussis]|nr:Uncharacterised protein [Bordetella pertussis]
MRRREPAGSPAICGVMRARAVRTNSPSACRRRAEPSWAAKWVALFIPG